MKTFVFIISFSLMLTSCVQEISPDSIASSPSLLIVDGGITNQAGPHVIKLTLSQVIADFEEPAATVSGAILSLTDGLETWDLAEREAGTYVTDSSVVGQIGRSYTLTILWEGKIYTATDSMVAVELTEELSFYPTSDPEFVGASFAIVDHQFGFQKPNQWELVVADTAYFRVIGNGGDSTLIDLPERIFTYYTHPALESNGLFTFAPTNYYGYPQGLQLTHRKYSLSAGYYDFLRALFSETGWRGGLFDTSPANLPTNLSDGASGYFYVRAIAEKEYYMPDL